MKVENAVKVEPVGEFELKGISRFCSDDSKTRGAADWCHRQITMASKEYFRQGGGTER